MAEARLDQAQYPPPSELRFQFGLGRLFELTLYAALLTAAYLASPTDAGLAIVIAGAITLWYFVRFVAARDATERASIRRGNLEQCRLLMFQSEYDRASEMVKDLLQAAVDNESRSAAHNTLGNLLALQGDFEAALVQFDEAFRLGGAHTAISLGNRGEAHLHLGRFRQAVDDCTAALSVDHHNSDALFNRGRARLRLGEHELALSDFDAVLRPAPEFAPALAERSLALESLGRAAEAHADRLAALAIDPTLVPGILAVVYLGG
ncbi:MAG TPA: tetratricopeptide repeat protein [Pirellulales bacterium]|jgi:tetratricopeptide (TPR) repeat protein|nr:tetratricopeptide repeat protein [Pirellulales bacterium]